MPNDVELRAGLDAAAAAGLIEAGQAEKLAAFLAGRSDDAGAPAPLPAALAPQLIPGEEDLRFVRNFHDVFLATGIVLLATGLAIAVGSISENLAIPGLAPVAALLAGAAAVMWGLGEVFSRKRRLFLPSIAICISFVTFSVFSAMLAYGVLIGERDGGFWDALATAEITVRASAMIAAGAGLAACLAFYARFRLPFSMGLSGLFGVLTMLGGVVWLAPGLIESSFPALLLSGGLAMFVLGVWFDMRDPTRATRISDNGFWLHLGAAPLILNGVLSLVGGGLAILRGDGESNLAAAIVTLPVVGLLGFTSLLINRRALIVSALFTTGIAVGALMKAVGMQGGGMAALTLVVLGGGVLILGAGWHDLRRALLRRMPITGFWAKVFPPEEPHGAPTNGAIKTA